MWFSLSECKLGVLCAEQGESRSRFGAQDVADALVEQQCGAWLCLKDASLPAEKN